LWQGILQAEESPQVNKFLSFQQETAGSLKKLAGVYFDRLKLWDKVISVLDYTSRITNYVPWRVHWHESLNSNAL